MLKKWLLRRSEPLKESLLRPVLKDHWRPALLLGLCMVGQTVLTLAQPWPIRMMIDHVTRSPVDVRDFPDTYNLFYFILESVRQFIHYHRLRFLYQGIGLLALIYLGNAFLLYVQNLVMSRLGQAVVLSIRKGLFSHIIALPQSFFEKSRSGDLTSRISGDTAAVQDILESVFTVLIRSIPTVVGILVVSFVLDWIYALTFVIVIPIIYLSNVFFTRRTREAIRTQRRLEGALASNVQESIYYHKAVATLSLEDEVVEDFLEQGRQSALYGVRAGRFQGMLAASLDFLIGLATLLVLFVGILRIIHGCLTIGQLMVFLTYLNSLFKPIREITKFSARLAKSGAALERIEEVMRLNPAEIGATNLPGAVSAPRFEGRIELDRVTFGYRPAQPVLKDFSLSVSPGEKIALVGDSGSGKSTVLYLLMRLYDPQEGQTKIDGTDIRKFRIESLREQMAVVLQDSYIFNMTIRDNIALARMDATDEEILQAAKAARADEFIRNLPDGYETQLGEGGAGLSGGQKRRLAIARAILRNTPLVLLDEPTTGLDAASEAKVSEALKDLSRDKTTLIVTHQLSTITDADRIVVLSGGKIVESGTHEELLARGGLYQELWGKQQGQEGEKIGIGVR